MKRALSGLTLALALLAIGCGTSSTTTTGPSLDRCSITVVNSMSSVGASGGSGRLTVTAGRECTWSVTSNVPWITPSPPAGGQGDGTVNFVVAANPSTEARRGTVATGGQVLEVVQEGLTCTFDLKPRSQNIGAEGGSGSFTVETQSGCSWTPVASNGWITITNGGSRSGNGSVSFTVAASPGGNRDGTIDVGGRSFTILQRAEAASCRYQLSAITGSFGGAGGSGTVAVSAASACAWTASADVPWISIVEGTTGAGNGTVSFTVQANPGQARNGILTIGGQAFTVTQQQAECSFSISPAGQSFTRTGGQGTVTLSTGSACTWNTSDVPVWVVGVPASRMGPQTITFTVAPNTGAARSANIIIGGQSFVVSQAAGCSYSLAPGSHSPSAAGGASSFAVTTAAGCAWTSSGVPAWITGVPGNGTGTTTIDFTVAANPDPAPRTANIIIGGQTFAVTQAAAAAPCSYALNPASHNAGAAGGASSFDVNTAAGCNWTSGGVPAWITGVPASGTGTTPVNFTVEANTGPARNASIVIEGQTFAVSQASGSACTYSVSPGSLTFALLDIFDKEIALTTGPGCPWTATPSASWIIITSNSSGTGSETITIRVDPLLFGERTGEVTIEGQTVTITQNGL